MGQWRLINLSEARTINIGTNKQKSKSIGMAALLRRWKMGVLWRGGGRRRRCGAETRFVDVATLRGRWRRISPSEAKTISIDTDKQQSAS
jgi:hypothetical protein